MADIKIMSEHPKVFEPVKIELTLNSMTELETFVGRMTIHESFMYDSRFNTPKISRNVFGWNSSNNISDELTELLKQRKGE